MIATLPQINRELGLRSFHEFVKQAFVALNPTKAFKDNWHIAYICGELQYEAQRIKNKQQAAYDHLIINVPPRSLKSEIASVYFPIWSWLQDASTEFIFSSYSQDLSNELSDKSKQVIRSAWFQRNYGELVKIRRGKDRIQVWSTTAGGVRISTSTGGTVTGKGGSLVIQDDPQNPKLAASEVQRQDAINFHKDTLSSRLNDPETGLFIIIMQRLHEVDLTGFLTADPERRIKHICIPAEYNEKTVKLPGIEKYPELRPYGCEIVNGHYIFTPGALMFPARFTAEVLKGHKINLGSLGYANQYSQEASPAEGKLFKKAWFQNNIISWQDYLLRLGQRKAVWSYFVDGAYTSKTENDPTALGSFTFIDGCLYIRGMFDEHIDSAYLAAWIEKRVKETGYTWESLVRMEPKASGLTVISAVKKETDINIKAYEYPKASGITLNDDKVTRANAVTPFCEGGRVFLIAGNWVQPFIDQAASFPTGKNDDKVDVLVMAILFYLFEKAEKLIEID